MASKKKRILVTGGAGFLGANLIRRLTADGHEVVAAKRSTSPARLDGAGKGVRVFDTDRRPLEDLFAGERVDVVVHCATDYGRQQEPAWRMADANVLFPLRLLELAARSATRVFVNTDTILDKRINSYALSKRHFAEWLEYFSPGMTAVNVALEHFFGPGDDPTKFVSHMVREVLAGVPSIALTPGRQERDFVYIDDVVEAFAVLIERSVGMPAGFRSYEVGTGRGTSIQDFMRLLARLSGNEATRLDFGALPYRKNEVMKARLDLRGLKALGWMPRVRLEEGLRRTIESERARMGRG